WLPRSCCSLFPLMLAFWNANMLLKNSLLPLTLHHGQLSSGRRCQQVSWEHTISTIEQIKLMHFKKMAIELESSMPMVAPQPIMNPAPTPVSTTSSIQRVPF
ncbi:hypothetical protein C0995_003864, partial [Termitomyces sp. Mi166